MPVLAPCDFDLFPMAVTVSRLESFDGRLPDEKSGNKCDDIFRKTHPPEGRNKGLKTVPYYEWCMRSYESKFDIGRYRSQRSPMMGGGVRRNRPVK
ncbi:hypothetical protein AVEN_208856-1 [Araneus ventricosus]|uniref:Uncharacterized protein n=1 Tax=Araneus ventricosus TaxID=182803 RepID=A0A4Y2KL72_ARAVE|nr:hypothetical protein AVEN_208856-1 [Araneus ventricosus]